MHAVCNHAADVAAKHAARAALRVDGSRLHALFYAAYRRHLWLQRLLAALPRTRVAVAAPADVDAQPSPLWLFRPRAMALLSWFSRGHLGPGLGTGWVVMLHGMRGAAF